MIELQIFGFAGLEQWGDSSDMFLRLWESPSVLGQEEASVTIALFTVCGAEPWGTAGEIMQWTLASPFHCLPGNPQPMPTATQTSLRLWLSEPLITELQVRSIFLPAMAFSSLLCNALSHSWHR